MAGQASSERTVDYLPLHEIVRAPRNPKMHHTEGIAASIGRFGVAELPLLDERTGRLVAGHGRLDDLAARAAAGEDPPDGVRISSDGTWLVPVVRGWASRSDADADAYLIASNQLTVNGGWDETALGELLAALNDLDPDLLAVTGFGEEDLADLLAGQDDGPPSGRTDPDHVPDPPPDPVSKLGDVWRLGPHRLYVGDCTTADVAERLGLTAGGVDLICTDPPYCSGGFQETGKSAGSVGRRGTPKQIANDRLSTRGYIALMKAALASIPARYAYVFTDWRMWVNLFDVVESSGFGVRSMVVWDKGTPGMGRGWRSQHELIMWASRQTAPFDQYASGAGNVVQAARTGNSLHTTQKPVDLVAKLLTVVPFAETVYDPFAGSGTTLIAAHLTGRTAHLCEMDPAYADVICRRWQEHTGDLPVLESTGQPVDFAADLEPANQ